MWREQSVCHNFVEILEDVGEILGKYKFSRLALGTMKIRKYPVHVFLNRMNKGDWVPLEARVVLSQVAEAVASLLSEGWEV